MPLNVSKTYIKILIISTIAISTFLLLLFNLLISNNNKNKQNTLLHNSADIISVKLANSLENRFSIVDALGSIYENYPDIEEAPFNEISEAILKNQRPIRAIQIANKDTYVKYTYPKKSNEKVYKKPIKLITDSLRGPWVKQTIETKEKSIQTPFKLRQGGIGTVIRKAVFKDTTFIGLAIIIVNLSDLLLESINDKEDSLFNIDLSDEKGNFFYNSSRKITSNSIMRKIKYPGTNWNLHISFKKNSNIHISQFQILLLITGFLITFLILIIEIGIYRYNTQLESNIQLKITELKEKQKKLSEAEKFRVVAQLASGIAHNFNNHLSTIIGFTELLTENLVKNKQHTKLIDYCNKILTVSNKSAHLVSKITSFSRQGKYREEEIDIHTILNKIVEKYSNIKNIEFVFNLKAISSIVMGDYSEIENALSSIIDNSIDAISDHGAIIIKTQNEIIDDSHTLFIEDHLGIGSYILIHIEDNGKGMDEKTVSHLFEPFFTTKNFAEGTGMGLPSAYGTILEHNGYIDIQSKIDKWTISTIYLPNM